MTERRAAEIGGYVLAGGRSSRMGRDKAPLELRGKPLVEHAVVKLRRVCGDVHILSSRSELAAYAPLVPDLREGCGPLGGIEAALLHSPYDWNLIMPVDMPFLPTALLGVLECEKGTATRVAVFTVEDITQPVPCLLHRAVAPYISEALQEERFKLLTALEGAAMRLAKKDALSEGEVFLKLACEEEKLFRAQFGSKGYEPWEIPTESQRAAKHLWFANLNTPEEFDEAERHADALDS